MKSKVPFWVAVGITVFLAVTSFLRSPTGEDLFATLFFLLFFGVLILSDPGKARGEISTVVSSAPFILLSWIHFGVQTIAGGALGATAYEQVGSNLGMYLSNGTVLFLIIALIGGAFFKNPKKAKGLKVTLRYVILLVLLPFLFRGNWIEIWMIAAALAVNWFVEFHTRNRAKPMKRYAYSLFMILCFIALDVTYSFCIADFYRYYLMAGDAFSIFFILLVGVLAGLIVMERTHLDEDEVFTAEEFAAAGPAMLFWCAAALIVLIFPSLNQAFVLGVSPFVLYHFYNYFRKEYQAQTRTVMENSALYGIGAIFTVYMLALSKCVASQNLPSTVFLCFVPFVSVMVWGSAKKGAAKNKKDPDVKEKVMMGYLGAASLIALASTSFEVDTLAISVFSIAILCVFWCLASSKIIRLNRTASLADKEEFLILAKAQKFVPLVVILVTLFKILFFRLGA